MTFRVEVLDGESEERRGFLSVETDDNPNNGVKVAEYDSVDEVRVAILQQIHTFGLNEPVFFEVQGEHEGAWHYRGMVFVEDDEWVWDLPKN